MRKIPCETCSSRANSVIRDVPLGALDSFRACTTRTIYRRRQIIFSEDSPANGLYIVCAGRVKLYQSDRLGREHIVHVAAPGEVLGELPEDLDARYSVSAEALTDSQLCFLPRAGLSTFIQEHPMTGVHLIAALSRTVSAAHRKVRALALKRAENRMAELLLDLVAATGPAAADGTQPLTIPYSRRELADMIGVAPETAIRLLARLREQQIISTNQRQLVIRDYEKLSRLAHHDELSAQ